MDRMRSTIGCICLALGGVQVANSQVNKCRIQCEGEDYAPVCASYGNGLSTTTAPNSCLAECFGMAFVSEGGCPGKFPHVQNSILEAGCLYDGGAQPVCAMGITWPNNCVAKQYLERVFGKSISSNPPTLPEEFPLGNCEDPCRASDCTPDRRCVSRPSTCLDSGCQAYKCVKKDCNCGAEWSPVCHRGITYTNKCWAKCDNQLPLTGGITKGECSASKTDALYPEPVPYAAPAAGGDRIVWVTDTLSECQSAGSTPAVCLRVSYSPLVTKAQATPSPPDRTGESYLHGSIEGFTYEEGYSYQLKVREFVEEGVTCVDGNGESASKFSKGTRLQLLEVMSKSLSGPTVECGDFNSCKQCSQHACVWRSGEEEGTCAPRCKDAEEAQASNCHYGLVGLGGSLYGPEALGAGALEFPLVAACPRQIPTVTMFVGDNTVECEGGGAPEDKCYLARFGEDSPWAYFYSSVEEFDFEPGFEYELIVYKDLVNKARGLYKYALKEMVSKTPGSNYCSISATCTQCLERDCFWAPSTNFASDSCRSTTCLAESQFLGTPCYGNFGDSSKACPGKQPATPVAEFKRPSRVNRLKVASNAKGQVTLEWRCPLENFDCRKDFFTVTWQKQGSSDSGSATVGSMGAMTSWTAKDLEISKSYIVSVVPQVTAFPERQYGGMPSAVSFKAQAASGKKKKKKKRKRASTATGTR